MKYVSTYGDSPPVDIETAILQGRPPDNGLYVPDTLPQITHDELRQWKDLSYPELAVEILSRFLGPDVLPRQDLEGLIRDSFSPFFHSEVIPHQPLGDDVYVQELFHGPTLSFKDVAVGFVVHLFDYFLRRRGERRTLMVATSGDTGPAVASAVAGRESLTAWVYYPENLLTPEQERQMTTVSAANVHAVCVSGCRNGSDDLDVLVNHCFADADFRDRVQLSSVNSINWARVMTQIVHYFYGYLRHTSRVGQAVHFAVPCGAFGNLCAGSLARRMGLPVGKFIAASNANGIVSELLETGIFPRRDIINTPASAIDIAVPMNFWRHYYYSSGADAGAVKTAVGKAGKLAHHQAFTTGFLPLRVSNTTTLSTIATVYEDKAYLLDPHGAVAVAGAHHYRRQLDGPIVALATAHPAKFPNVIREATGTLPPSGHHPVLEREARLAERLFRIPHASLIPEARRLILNHQPPKQ